jgi:hypothetical protein
LTNSFSLRLDGTAGQRYALFWSSDLAKWTPLQTNTLAGSSWPLSLPTTNATQRFYRGAWVP